jgi:hypothetical protein
VLATAAISMPLTPSNLGLFIAYMFQHKYAPSTANIYVSALGYCHRLVGAHDPTRVFWAMEMLKGYRKLGPRIDSRLPVTLPILRNIITVTPSLCSSVYNTFLFKAMCTTAFFAFLRVGEITYCPRSPAVLQVKQVVKLEDPSGATVGLKINFDDFKHSYNQPHISITLSRRSDICPVQSLLDYLSHRGLSDGPLFQMFDGHPVSRKTFSDFLLLVFRSCGLDSSKYKGHSFRIGAATFAASCGFSDAQIRAMGRWKSDAFRKYIRLSNMPRSSFRA